MRVSNLHIKTKLYGCFVLGLGFLPPSGAIMTDALAVLMELDAYYDEELG